MSKLTDIHAHPRHVPEGEQHAKPRDADLQRLNKTLAVCTLSVTLTRTTAGCASGLVLPEAVYQTNHRGAFNLMLNAHPEYDLEIERLSKDDRLSKMRGMEHRWAVRTANQSRIRVVKVGARNLILANVELTWVQELSVPGTFYTGVPVRTILDHLEKDGSGLD